VFVLRVLEVIGGMSKSSAWYTVSRHPDAQKPWLKMLLPVIFCAKNALLPVGGRALRDPAVEPGVATNCDSLGAQKGSAKHKKSIPHGEEWCG